jgi:hypothetical protein
MEENLKNIFRMKVSKLQCKDTGMAFVLLSLILYFLFSDKIWLVIATVILVIAMCTTGILVPFARLWFGMSQLIGTYVSKLLLFIIFFVIITPVGWLRRFMKKDNLKLKQFKKGRKSVMDDRNITYKPDDIAKPF